MVSFTDDELELIILCASSYATNELPEYDPDSRKEIRELLDSIKRKARD